MKVTLLGENPFWISILESEGVPFRIVDSVRDLGDPPPIIIAWRDPGKPALEELARVTASGSSILLKQSQLKHFPGNASVEEIAFPFSRSDFSRVLAGRENATVGLTEMSVGKGSVLGLLADIEPYWSSGRKAYKTIAVDAGRGEFVQESMAKIVKYNIRRYVRKALIRAFGRHGMPLVYVWRFPGTASNVCNLRVDVDPDRTTPNDVAVERIARTFASAQTHAEKTTFFLNLYKRAPDVTFFRRYTSDGFDLQNHNYFHCLFPDQRHNRKNFELAHQILTENGVSPEGFSCPEYYWYDSTQEILDGYGYRYSHSFGLDYNNYPYRPVVAGRLANYVEIPNDPLVFSKFSRLRGGMSIEETTDVYLQTLQDKLDSFDIPCMKYEHPNVLGSHPGVMERMYAFFDARTDMRPTTLTEWSRWWHRRRELLPQLDWEFETATNTLNFTVGHLENARDFGIAMQFDDETFHVHGLDTDANQVVRLDDCHVYRRRSNPRLLDQVVFNPSERAIDFRSRRHRRKVFGNYRLFHRYRRENFYLP